MRLSSRSAAVFSERGISLRVPTSPSSLVKGPHLPFLATCHQALATVLSAVMLSDPKHASSLLLFAPVIPSEQVSRPQSAKLRRGISPRFLGDRSFSCDISVKATARTAARCNVGVCRTFAFSQPRNGAAYRSPPRSHAFCANQRWESVGAKRHTSRGDVPAISLAPSIRERLSVRRPPADVAD